MVWEPGVISQALHGSDAGAIDRCFSPEDRAA